MKRSLIFCLVMLMLGFVPVCGGNVTHSTENLVFGEMWMEGGCRANLIQGLHVEVTNKGTKDYQGYWVAIDKDNYSGSSSGLCEIAAGVTKDVIVYISFEQPGHYDVHIMKDDYETELFTYPVDIAEYQPPHVIGEIRLDMLEKTDDGNILYGDFAQFKMTGTATITNEGEDTVFGWGKIAVGGGSGIQCVVWPWFGKEYITTYEPFYSLGGEIKAGETITKDFYYEFEAVPEEDKEYGIQIAVNDYVVTRVPFKVVRCTNTYWTTDGHIKPLPKVWDGHQVLQVPADALAVDLRGQYALDEKFSIDVSQANPNCLYYLGYLDNVPQGFSLDQNLIRDYEARTLVVDADYDYYCPMPFKAKTALFNYTPISEARGLPNPTMSQIMSGALVLPFDATQASLTAINNASGSDAGFDRDDLRIFRFKEEAGLKTVDDEPIYEILFEPVKEQQLNAYEPYLMTVLPSPVAFYATNATIPSTRPAIKEGTHYDFIGHTTQAATPEGVYRWNCDKFYFYQSDTDDMVRPFSSMMYQKSEGVNYEKLFVTTPYNHSSAGIKTYEVTNMMAVHSLSGQQVGTAVVNGDGLKVSGLRPGLYIVGGKKVVVR